MSKEQLVINKSKTDDTSVSICDLTKNNASMILQKMEYQVPIYLQGYSDLFTKYIHSFNTAFGACRISEKQYFDKLGIDHTVLEETAAFWNYLTNLALIQIESYSKFVEDYITFGISTVESFDKSMASALDYYEKALSVLNKKP